MGKQKATKKTAVLSSAEEAFGAGFKAVTHDVTALEEGEMLQGELIDYEEGDKSPKLTFLTRDGERTIWASVAIELAITPKHIGFEFGLQHRGTIKIKGGFPMHDIFIAMKPNPDKEEPPPYTKSEREGISARRKEASTGGKKKGIIKRRTKRRGKKK